MKSAPFATLEQASTEMLADWTARKFIRPALPDEFNRRRQAVMQKVIRAAARCPDMTAIYIALNDDAELAPDEKYEIFVLATVLPVVEADKIRFAKVAETIQTIALELDSAQGISVLDFSARSEGDVSLFERRQLLRLELDYLSARDGNLATQ